ncbi:hypothetical protein V8G54_034397 [Vigna mungo]|uniref:Uncharacterized protein n=1 Tax=Vigna mungo TaxID=3915 RepID=A0AAQ3MRJ5_VIGMU
MASTQCFLHHHALTNPARASPQRQVLTTKPKHIVCKAQKQVVQEGDANTTLVSRRLALTVLIGAAAVGSKVSPADAAYGEAGISPFFTSFIAELLPSSKKILDTGEKGR